MEVNYQNNLDKLLTVTLNKKDKLDKEFEDFFE
jgi:hypothetical protein